MLKCGDLNLVGLLESAGDRRAGNHIIWGDVATLDRQQQIIWGDQRSTTIWGTNDEIIWGDTDHDPSGDQIIWGDVGRRRRSSEARHSPDAQPLSVPPIAVAVRRGRRRRRCGGRRSALVGAAQRAASARVAAVRGPGDADRLVRAQDRRRSPPASRSPTRSSSRPRCCSARRRRRSRWRSTASICRGARLRVAALAFNTSRRRCRCGSRRMSSSSRRRPAAVAPTTPDRPAHSAAVLPGDDLLRAELRPDCGGGRPRRGSPPIDIWRQHFLWLSVELLRRRVGRLLPVRRPASGELGGARVVLPLSSYLPSDAARRRSAASKTRDQHVAQIDRLYLSTVETLAMAIDAKDDVTHSHIRRVQAYAVGARA